MPPPVRAVAACAAVLLLHRAPCCAADGGYWEQLLARPRNAARLGATAQPAACSLSGEWTGLLKPSSLAPTFLDDAYTITDDGANATVSCDEAQSGKTCGWKTGVVRRLRNGVNKSVSGAGAASLEIVLSSGVRMTGTLRNCTCIEWENDSAWAKGGDLLCGRPQNITKVHVVFMNHLDVGFNMANQKLGPDNGFIAPVLNRYTQVYFPLAIQLAQQMRAAGKDRFVYTTHPWLVSLYVDCPRHLELAKGTSLRCPEPAELQAFEEAVQRGDIVWHHGPFNLQSENVGPAGMFEDGLRIADALDRRYNVSTPPFKVYNLRDVPGTTRAVVPLLAAHGFGAITVGQNPGTPPSAGWPLHKVFRWRDPPSGAEIVGLNHAGGYPSDPGSSAAKCGGLCREDCMMAPGVADALCFAFRTDNSGPPTSAAMVQSIFSILRDEFPGAAVAGSTLHDFVGAVMEQKAALDVYTAEIGDTWIQGVQSDPLKMAQYREIVRAREDCIAAGKCRADDPEIANATRLLLSIPEHTWGLPGASDYTNWANPDFAAARAGGKFNYAHLDEGWREHRVFNHYAAEALKGHPSGIYDVVAPRLAALTPKAEPDPAAAGYRPAAALTAPFGCGGAAVAFDGATGALSRCSLGGVQWGGTLGALRYSTYTDKDFDEMNAVYHGPLGGGCGYSKPGMDAHAPFITRADYAPVMEALHVRGDNCSALARLRMPAGTVADYGAAPRVWLNVTAAGGAVLVDAQFFNKTRTRLAEAMHYEFRPAAPRGGYNWTMDKLGTRISPFETVVNGNPLQHAVWDGVFFERAGEPTLQLRSLDAAVVSPATRDTPATPFLKDMTPLNAPVTGMAYNLWNNIWNVNYPLYYPYEDADANLRFRFEIRVDAADAADASAGGGD